MSFLISLDIKLFYFFNNSIANSVFDVIMPVITDLDNWLIPIAIFWFYLIIKGGKRGRIVAILIIPVIILTDQTSSAILKPWIGRIRPCYELDHVRMLVGCGGKLSFPSSHATNMAGFAVLFSLFYSRQWYIYWSLAVLIGFSRVYVGKHYPLDVLGGFVIGALLGWVIYYMYQVLASKLEWMKLNNSE
ncbi:MAG: phosphatase PAP2 family protein [Calditrichia bacterium]